MEILVSLPFLIYPILLFKSKRIIYQSVSFDHNKLIIDQFTKQAIPFTKKAARHIEETFEKILSVVNVDHSDVILDVACGSGLISIEFAKISSQVTGIDITPAMIQQAKLLQQKNMLDNVKWDIHDISGNLPYPTGSFSIVASRFSFHHLLNPLSVLNEMNRVCAVGGQIVVIDPTPPPDKVDMFNHVEKLRDPSHVKALTVPEFEDLFKKAAIPVKRKGFYRMNFELEEHLLASFPKPDDVNKIRQLFIEDTKKNLLGLESHFDGDKIYFSYPNSIFVGLKEQ
jgi:ubiquinone/menaquinone biosynthesis C-methylase UbiE